MRVLIITDNDILEGNAEEIVAQFNYRAEENPKAYMKEFADRYKLMYGNPLFYHDAESFIRNLDGIFLRILEDEDND